MSAGTLAGVLCSSSAGSRAPCSRLSEKSERRNLSYRTSLSGDSTVSYKESTTLLKNRTDPYEREVSSENNRDNALK